MLTSGWLEHAGDLSSALPIMVSPCAVSTESSRWFKGLSWLLQKSLLTSLYFNRVNVPLLFWWSRTPTVQFSEPSSQVQSGLHSTTNLVSLSFEILSRESEHFYGTGESFLFTCKPRWNFYSWAGDNQVTFIRTPLSTENLWNLTKICGEKQKLFPSQF